MRRMTFVAAVAALLFGAAAQAVDLTMAVNGQGTTEPAVGDHTVTGGEPQSITATPAPLWVFDSWAGDNIADTSSADTTVTLEANQTVTAVFTGAPPTSPVPTLINYQGQLVDSNSDPLTNGEYELTFNIYDAKATPRQKTWGPQTLLGVKTSNGFYNVNLGPADGDGNPISSAFMAWPGTWQPGRYLEITVVGPNDEQVLEPQEILTTPYAMHAENEVPAGAIISYAGILDGTHPVPDGWLLCDGSAVKSTDYPGLHAAIQDYWGDGSSDGDAETDFNIPELTDTMYLRGADPGGLLDQDVASRTPQGPTAAPGDVGSTQEHSAGAHTHGLKNHTHSQGDLYARIGFDSGTERAYVDFIPLKWCKDEFEEEEGKEDPCVNGWDNWGDDRNLLYRGVQEIVVGGTTNQATDVSGDTGDPDEYGTAGMTEAPETPGERTLPVSLEVYFLIRY